jgi:hypothetical protein
MWAAAALVAAHWRVAALLVAAVANLLQLMLPVWHRVLTCGLFDFALVAMVRGPSPAMHGIFFD